MCIFLDQNAYITNFLSNFLIFWQLWSNFRPLILFFPIFFQLIITYHVFFILDYPHFIILCVFFCVKMQRYNTNFFSNFLIFWPNLWASHTFLQICFQLIITYPVFFYSRLASFYKFVCIFLGQNAYNTNFFTKFSQFFSFLTTLT